MDSPEDILSTSLSTLYHYSPLTHSTPGSAFTYSLPDGQPITLLTPDSSPSNWSLHASSIWTAALHLAHHIDQLAMPSSDREHVQVLELGAGAGLPSIVLAKRVANARVTISDYPDPDISKILQENVSSNGVSDRCHVVPHAWGTDVTPLLRSFFPSSSLGFDTIMAADTIWSATSHNAFITTLSQTLRRSPDACIYLVAGLHTGRYTIQSFLDKIAVIGQGLVVQNVVEREIDGTGTREWKVDTSEGEDVERERRRWVVWIMLKWKV